MSFAAERSRDDLDRNRMLVLAIVKDVEIIGEGPKLYLGSRPGGDTAVIGSANLTGGLATNFEAAVALRGTRDDAPLARAWAWAEDLWSDDRVEPWTPRAAEQVEDGFDEARQALDFALHQPGCRFRNFFRNVKSSG